MNNPANKFSILFVDKIVNIFKGMQQILPGQCKILKFFFASGEIETLERVKQLIKKSTDNYHVRVRLSNG